MRVFAWLLVLGLFLFSALCFVAGYQAGDASISRAQPLKDLAIALSGFVPHQANDALAYLHDRCTAANIGIALALASAGLGVLCLVILAATHQRRRERRDRGDNEDDDMIARIRRL